MLPAQHACAAVDNGTALAIRVRNSYNLEAPGSLICATRDVGGASVNISGGGGGELTAIVVKADVHLLDIVSTRMLGNYGFLARVFDVFRQARLRAPWSGGQLVR